MSSENEDSRKKLKETLREIDVALKEKIPVCLAIQELNRMCRAAAEKNPVKSLQIGYSVFFQWEDKRVLQKKLSLPVSSYCQLINESIIGPHTIEKCERLEIRLKKESSRILSKYKTLKGQHRSLHKAKAANILLFQGEILEPEDAPARLKIAGKKSYDDLCDRQKQRRRTEIGKKLQEYLGGLDQEAGLLPMALETKTTKRHDSISIPLGNGSADGASSSSPLADSDEIPLESVQYLIMKYNIPMQFYHELSMLFSDLPRSHKLKQLKKEISTLPVKSTPGTCEGAQYDFIDLLKEKITEKTVGAPSLFTNNKVQVKISMDGANYGRASNFCILSFTLLKTEKELSSSNVHTVAAIKCRENYENISESFKDVFTSINRLINEPVLLVDDTEYDVEVFLCCDYKMILLLMGLKEATATHSCVWCTISKDERWDMDVTDDEYLITQKRTLQSFYDNYRNKNDKGCKHLPLINIDPDYIIPDELHLLLRITDVLISNLISAAKTDDIKHKKNCKLLDGPMVNSLINNIRSCGVNFNIWGTEKSFDFTSLMGDSKKALLKNLPSKLLDCQPRRFASDVQRLWEDFRDIYAFITSKNPAVDYNTLHNKAKNWIKSFWKLGHVCAGYKQHNVTPYMHIMTYHVPNFIRKFGSIKQFSCQGVEKKNDECKRVFFRSSNKWNATADILLHQEKVDQLTVYQRKKRAYNKENNHDYWINGGIVTSRAKRRKPESEDI